MQKLLVKVIHTFKNTFHYDYFKFFVWPTIPFSEQIVRESGTQKAMWFILGVAIFVLRSDQAPFNFGR